MAKEITIFTLVALFADLFLWVPSTGLMALLVFVAGIFVTGVAIGTVNALFARFRIDQAVRWLFIFSTALSLIGILWAVAWRFFL